MKMTCGEMFWSIKEHFLTRLISKPLHNRRTNLRESRASTCWHAVFLPSHCRRWHSWSSPSHTHTHARTRSNTHHTSSPLYPSILHVHDGVRTAKEKLWSLFVSLSFSPPPTSLTLGGVETRPPYRARLFCLSNSKRAQPYRFFFPSLSVSLPSFPPFSSHRACIFN